VYEQFRPWTPADSVLPVSQHQHRVLVGFNIHRTDDSSEYTMTYAVFPDILDRPAIYTLHQKNGGTVSMKLEQEGLLQLILPVGLALVACAIAWMVPTIPRVT
jgi:hypothetical protein